MNISQHMQAVLDAARRRGGTMRPVGGGYWVDADGVRLDFPNMTQTVYALERRLLVKRLAVQRERHRDTRVVADYSIGDEQ
jgi:hypothetical protein